MLRGVFLQAPLLGSYDPSPAASRRSWYDPELYGSESEPEKEEVRCWTLLVGRALMICLEAVLINQVYKRGSALGRVVLIAFG